MDTLKLFEEIFEPDSRQQYFVKVDRSTLGRSQITLHDHYAEITEIRLLDAVPAHVQEHFETARNLLLYSWFVYRFIQVAELHAFASLEIALREKIGREVRGLKKLLDMAIREGVIKDSGFNLYQQARETRLGFPLSASSGKASADIDTQGVQKYCKLLADTLPKFRNELAHGSDIVAPGGYRTLALCADLINQLYTEKK